MSDYRTFIDPETGLEYQRIPASEFPDGDQLESTEELAFPTAYADAPELRRAVAEFGFIANDRSAIASYTVPGTTTRLALRKGDCSVILLDWDAWFHANIEPIDHGALDDWGFAERLVRGSSSTWSRHSWGGANDLNATQHPLGVHNTFNAIERAKMHKHLAYYEGTLRLGMDYTSRPDDMHAEINAGPAALRVVANKIRARGVLKPVTPPMVNKPPAPYGYTTAGDRVLGLHDPLLEGPDVRNVQNALRYIGNVNLKVTGGYDRATADAVNLLKSRHGFTEKGCGQQCWSFLRSAVPH